MNSKHKLAISAVYKNETPYLEEWLRYHQSIDVSHIFLYDNDGNEEAKNIIQPYIRENFVTYIDWHLKNWPYKNTGLFRSFAYSVQHSSYTNTVRKFSNLCHWILKIDIDEFLVPMNNNMNVSQMIDVYDPSKIKEIWIPRYDFGNNGHLAKPNGGVLSNYTKRESEHSNYKAIVNTTYLTRIRKDKSSHHWPLSLKRGKRVLPDQVTNCRIYHYYSKSKEEFFKRQNCSGKRCHTDAYFEQRNKNEVEDQTLSNYARKKG